MKKFLALTAVLILISTSAFALITGSAHDFQGYTFVNNTQICEPCHVPHGATNATAGPLWNHDDSTNAGTFTLYGTVAPPGSDLDATMGQPAGVSLLCLGCHDGSVNLDAFGGTAVGADGGVPIVATAFVGNGGNLGTDHPVSFTYNTALTVLDPELNDPSDVAFPTALTLFGASSDQLECGTCHDVHAGPSTTGNPKLLNRPLAASAICLDCHAK